MYISAPLKTVECAWEQLGESVQANLLQVRAIAEKHGGAVDIQSKQWEGTTVTIVLPEKYIWDPSKAQRPDYPTEDETEEAMAA